MKARAIPCPHQPPSRGDNTVSVAQGGTATPGATKQLLPPDRVLRESYIYTPDQLNAETILDVNLHFLSAVCDLKNAFTFSGWCYYAFTVTVSYVITRERWFCVYYLHVENFLAFDQIQLDAYRAMVWRRFEATFKLRPVIPVFERNEMTECPIKPRQPTSIGITWHIQPFFTQSARSLVAVFLPLVCFLPVFFPRDSQFYEEDTLLWIGPCYNVRPLFRLNNVNWRL